MEGRAAMSQATQTPAQPAAPAPQSAVASSPDLLYSEDETDLRGAVRSLLEDQAAWPDVLARTETGQAYDTGLWRTLAEQVGVAGLLVPPDQGGAGASYRELAVVAEELGRAVAPVPFLGSAVMATTALLSAVQSQAADGGDAEGGAAGRELVASLAGGTVTAALAVPFAAGAAGTAVNLLPAPTVRVTGPASGDGAGTYRLSGPVAVVADALTADVLLVPADGVPYGLYLVRADDPGVTRAGVVSLDMTRQLCDLTLDGARATQLAAGGAAGQAVVRALVAGAGIIASEQLGLADRCLEMTVAYVKERRQFARPVGSFQAVKHRLADLWVAVVQARAAARYAAACLAAADPDTALAVALAKATCSDVALRAAQETVQLHGGIGFTWEHPAHLYLKRAKADSIGLGTADAHRASLARLADLPPAGAAGA
jgi:alkylation response protein AidB-like acyl-CoA dehydrogenase